MTGRVCLTANRGFHIENFSCKRVLPKSPAALLEIRGIGPAKAIMFGPDALAVIAKQRSG